jgi:hypothetical protein
MLEPTEGGLAVLDREASETTRDSDQETRSISYWTNTKGQEMIDSFDGSNNSTNLSSWLAQTHPSLFGDKSGSNNLWGQKNRGVAAFAQVIEMMYGPEGETCRALAEALNEYARLA